MENQGFEEEHQPRSEFSDGSILNADGHVYEDILPGVEDKSGKDPRQGSNAVDHLPIDAATRSLDREEMIGAFRRNLTLPFRRSGGLDRSTANSSVRLTNRKRTNDRHRDAEVATWNADLVADDTFASRDIATRAQSTTLQIECRPNRRRRKKDCKHCRSKAAASNDASEREIGDRENETVPRKNRDNEQQERLHQSNANDSQTILDPHNFVAIPTRSPVGTSNQLTVNDSSSIFTISEKIATSPASTMKLIGSERNEGRANFVDSTDRAIDEDNDFVASKKTRTDMRVNSIYSQDRWCAKEAAIFFTDVKERGSFQRAYSLPIRAQTPSSQNRINLRRSVRGEPPPHPARLRKHRHGWTLHLARPLEASGCTRSLVLLLIALLVLLGIGAVALYIAFEPEKLNIIQQYLRSSTNDSSANNNVESAGTILRRLNDEQGNETSTVSSTSLPPPPPPPPINSTLVPSILLNSDRSFPESGTTLASEAETEATSPFNLNSTRYCDDCLPEEVCVALVDEEVPTCRFPLDLQDPTGCAGFCLINKQKCHRLDVDAFRCVEVEHYCLDDEWTCLNTLCIPLEKHCDGHMNCYDHSDEYNCVCDLETHFQCGNETSCLPLVQRCDGKIDCWDAADEINCTLACPSENEFTCSNGQCILKVRFCDGLPDCSDGSDEPHGCQGRCNKHEFTCQNSRCVTKGMKCNGVDDCGDGTDERHCKNRFS